MLALDLTRGGEGRTDTCRCSAKCAARTSSDAAALRALPAHPAVDRRATSTSRSAASRRPSAPSRGATYATDNPLIGYPLALSVPDVAPARRAAGERRRAAADARPRLAVEFSRSASPPPDRGVPLASAFRWDTGVQVHAAAIGIEATAAVTDRDALEPAVRATTTAGGSSPAALAVQPVAGLVARRLGRARPVPQRRRRRSAPGDAPGRRSFTQTAWGADVEYSRALLPRARRSDRQPLATVRAVSAPAIDGRSARVATSVEGRYKLAPGLYAAARVDHLGFSDRHGHDGDASLGRAGDAGRDRRRLFDPAQPAAEARRSAQPRDGGRAAAARTLGAAQLVFWF